MTKSNLALTRVANACVLVELDGHAVLTDPWFTERWYLRRGEPLGLPIADLPPLTAIVASSFAANHWDLRALAAYSGKATTPVYVSTGRMARQARALGYRQVEVLRWHDRRQLGGTVSLVAAPAGRTLRWPNNAYALIGRETRIYFGGEIRDVAHLREYRARHGSVAVALLPTNGLRPLVGPPLVMGPREAVAGAEALGARVLVPVHDAHARDLLSLVFRRHGSAADAEAMAPAGLDVVRLDPGQRWELP
ncbi:L-ascorbate metabolism protein UlaG, beta-lactamase superfamily [Micromonospora viridifaciens]|uniref:L-ascorbate metabolism protein UlaG, beta-lactamase superfamily n=1 Tax=Micromonospora viridifaciens TaxID=1881 RepID=A0A1C4YEG5_MICVI|nr:MBL fold metallo-hydrolase [Micromonospora viridifaciens]SCF19098.1 L-ascorbate metabolism protein UlaG, beta-lactamase superfamily [Micromonospora viridifaciens]